MVEFRLASVKMMVLAFLGGCGGAAASTDGTGAAGAAGWGGGTSGGAGTMSTQAGGGTVGPDGGQAGSGQGGSNPVDTPAVCRTPAPGSTFTMHVRNAGASPLTFSFGCADKPRAYVQTPDGFLRMWWLYNDSGSAVVEEPAGHADRTC